MQAYTPLSKTKIMLFAGIMLLIIFVGIALVKGLITFNNNIYNGVRIAGIQVSGLSSAEASKKIESHFHDYFKNPIIIIEHSNKKWQIPAQQIDLILNIEQLAKQAQSVGRNGSFINKIRERYQAAKYGYDVPLVISINEKKLHDILKTIALTIDRAPQNASININGKSRKVVPEIVGYKTSIDKIAYAIQLQLTKNLTAYIKLDNYIEKTYPKIVAADFNDITSLISSYVTQFDPKNINRTHNITLASNAISNTLLKPHQIFSFNQKVGLRLAKFGYKEAPVIINEELVPGVGGGVCQVSTTLYNAVLLADLKIVERTAHSLPPGYVPLGRDATVVDNYLDFRFQNNSDSNIIIVTSVIDDELSIEIYGKKRSKIADILILSIIKKVIEPKTVTKQDDKLEIGKTEVQDGQKGYEVLTYRVKILNDREISRELLAKDEFNPINKIIKVGTKKIQNQTIDAANPKQNEKDRDIR